MAVPEHVFLSHSTSDAEPARELGCELEAAGIPIWIDSSRLTPSTPDWEMSIRDAISRSYAVIVLASPETSASRFVRAELALAESIGRQIYPIWLRGERWVECISLAQTNTQYIDLRGDERTRGLQTLVDTLSRKVAELMPDHYLVAPLHIILSEDQQSVSCTTVCPPRGHVSIELPRCAADEEGTPLSRYPGRAAFFRLSKFHTVWDLLDVLFIEYLANDFRPYTYGQHWILRESAWTCGPRSGCMPWLISLGHDAPSGQPHVS